MKAILTILAIFATLALCAAARAQTPLHIARIEKIPDQFVGGEILKVVYKRLNIPMELVDRPAKRALMESSTGMLDGEVQRNIHVESQYPTLKAVRPAINYIEPSVFSAKYQFEIKAWDDIKDYSIGIVRGVGTSEDGTKGMKTVYMANSLEQLMIMLSENRMDVAVSDAFSGLVVIKKLGLENKIRLLTPPLQRTEIYHFLHEKHKDLIPKVEQVIRTMQASGELEKLRKQIIEKYLSQTDMHP
ncbi:substrate-binding periplasmic protein [Undibacterium sp. Ji83W]|uniref:substrate-binding periplasmic protein n=1 Tax=Undibacterium sp. Ji83W TaxID=3413043 RepID=UPI003BF35A0B